MTPKLPPRCAATFVPRKLIASGGYGSVWLADHARLGSQAALKLLDEHVLGDAEQVQRFQDEARVTARLAHAGIVKVLDHDVEDGTAWIAYEYLDGGSLRGRLARGPLPVAEAVRIAAQIAAALEVVHTAGVLHRDLKPENVLDGDGVWKLADFGIAKSQAGRVETRTGVILGTPAYLDPEVIQGGAPTAAADLYALGVLLHEMIAGAPPFDAANMMDVLRAHIERPPPPLTRPGVRPGLGLLVSRLLSKRSADRPASAAEVRIALEVVEVAPGLDPPGPEAPGSRAPAPRRSLDSAHDTRVSAAYRAGTSVAAAPPARAITRAVPAAIACLAVLGAIGVVRGLRPVPPIPISSAAPSIAIPAAFAVTAEQRAVVARVQALSDALAGMVGARAVRTDRSITRLDAAVDELGAALAGLDADIYDSPALDPALTAMAVHLQLCAWRLINSAPAAADKLRAHVDRVTASRKGLLPVIMRGTLAPDAQRKAAATAALAQVKLAQPPPGTPGAEGLRLIWVRLQEIRVRAPPVEGFDVAFDRWLAYGAERASWKLEYVGELAEVHRRVGRRFAQLLNHPIPDHECETIYTAPSDLQTGGAVMKMFQSHDPHELVRRDGQAAIDWCRHAGQYSRAVAPLERAMFEPLALRRLTLEIDDLLEQLNAQTPESLRTDEFNRARYPRLFDELDALAPLTHVYAGSQESLDVRAAWKKLLMHPRLAVVVPAGHAELLTASWHARYPAEF